MAIAVGVTVAAQAPSPVALKVRSGPYLGFSVLRIAQEEGLFAKQGLKVELIEMDANSTIPALVRGDIDVLPATLIPATLNAIVRGARIRVVASHGEYVPGGCAQSALVARQPLIDSGKLNEPDGLKGLKVGMARSLINDFVLDRWLRPYGLSSEDLSRVDVPEAIEAESVRTGRLDIGTMGEPALTRAVAAGDVVVWKSFNDLAPGLQFGTVLYGSRLLDRQPDIGHRFLTAYVEANRRFAQGKTARNVDILSRSTGLPPDLVSRLCWPAARLDATVNVTPLEEYVAWASAKGLIDRALKYDEIVDTRFTDSVRRQSSTGR